MDKDSPTRKSLVFGIIVLFIGVSFMPSLSGDVKDLDLSYVKDVNYFESKNLEPGQTDDGTIETGGRGWSAAEIVSDECDFLSDHCTLDVDGLGRLHIAWQDSSGSADILVFYRTRTKQDVWTWIETVSTDTIYFALDPSLVAEPLGTAHVVWEDSWYAGQQADVIYRIRRADGGWLPWEIVTTDSVGHATPYPCIAVDYTGVIHVVWKESYYGTSGIYYKKKIPGVGWTSAEEVANNSMGDLNRPRIAVDRGGTVYVVWGDTSNYAGCGNDWDIFYKKKPVGGNWTVTEVVSSESTQISAAASLAVDSLGTVHVAWHDDTDFGDPSWTKIVYKNKPRDGTWITTEVISTGGLTFKMYPSLTVDYENNVHVAWCAGYPSDYDIYYRMKPYGENWTATELVSTESWDNSMLPSLAVDVFGTLHVAWEDDTDHLCDSGTDRDIFYKNKVGGGAGLPPPSGCFGVERTPHPRIVRFTANITYSEYATLKWDFDGDMEWDRTGPFSQVHSLTYKYPDEGIYNITLYVENPTGNTSCSKEIVVADYDITWSNPDFFLSYNSSSTRIAPLKNKYRMVTPQGIFDEVEFQIGSFSVTDDTPTGVSVDTWEGVLHMNEGEPADTVKIKGYMGGVVTYEETVETTIISTPGWFINFLKGSFVSVEHESGFPKWTMDVQPVTFGMSFGMPDIDCDFIGGDYGIEASVDTPDRFTIDSSELLTVELVKGSFGVSMDLGSYPNAKVKVSIFFYPSASVRIDQDDGVALVGYLTLEGSAGVSFDIPIFCIPFLVEAGFTGGVDSSIGVGFSIVRFANDGITFCSGEKGEVYFTVGAHAGVYGEILKGIIGRVEGGLEVEGKLTIELPSRHKTLTLYGGAYAKASALSGLWSDKWKTGITVTKSLNGRGYPTIVATTDAKSHISRTMDLLCLKEFDIETLSSDSSSYLLSGNVVETADPKLVLTNDENGLAVWTDIDSVDNNSIQTDIWWSEYTATTGWSDPMSMNTTSTCEFGPTLVAIEDEQGNQSVVMTHLMVDDIIDENSSVETFYNNITIKTALWTNITGWSFLGDDLSFTNTTVNAKDICYAGNNTVYLTYLLDSNLHPWENGNGSIYIVEGIVNDSIITWDNPVLVKDLGSSLNFSCKPHVSFLYPDIGGVAYTWWNTTSRMNELILSATVSELNSSNFTETIIRNTDVNIEHVSSNVVNDSVIVSWVENHSSIRSREILVNESLPSLNWTINDTMLIYDGLSISYAKPVYSENKSFYLFQTEEGFIPFVIEQLSNGSWGHLRQISLKGPYSPSQMDGDHSLNGSQMIYIRDKPIEDWQVGHWKFNEGEGTSTRDSSDFENHGELVGDPLWLKHSGENDSLEEEYGYYLGFNDTGDYVRIPYNNSLDVTSEFTTSCWIQLNEFSSSPGTTLVGKNNSWEIHENNGSLEVKLWRENDTVVLSNITDLSLGNWTFVAVVYDHGKVTISVYPFKGSNATVEYDLEDIDINTTDSTLIIGGFNGTIDEVRLFTRALSGDVIDSIWFAPYATLGSIHDVVVQHLPSFASFDYSVGRDTSDNVTTEDTVQFTGSPSGFDFEWDFGDGTTTVGEVVTHRYNTSGFYNVVCNATDPNTNVVTPVTQTLCVNDTTTPLFDGLESATAGDCSVDLNWSSATDTSPFILYHVYIREEGELFNFSSPQFITHNTSFTVPDLSAGVTYYFVVRAQDAAGNRDNNTVEKSATPYDLTPPIFNGLDMACNVTNSPGTVFLSWDHAEDPSPPIVYNVYMANVSGGQNFSSPLDSTNMTWYEINELEDEMYYFVVRAEDAWDNEDNNTVEKSVRPFVDTSSPIITDMEANPSVQTFGGCVNITCEVRDNTKIDTVKVNITYPNESYVNQTMIHILGTDNYYYNSTYTDIGTYYYFIWANDTYNNAYTSSTHSFAIIDPPPEITNVTDYPDPQLTGGYVNISCDASDNVEVDVVKVNITYPNSETVNETMGGSYFYNTTYALSGTYSYYIWANDTNGNENVSAVYTFNIGPIINLDTGELFFTIQNAIDDSDTLDGHTIFVHNDTYYENIVIDKSINLIGEKRENTVIDGSRSDTVVSVVAPGVNISGFTIQNSSSDWGDAGISVSSNHTNITGNIITNNSWANGIFVTASSHTTISENTIKNNYYGVYLEDGSSLNTISWNTIRTNQLGIYVYTSSFNTILENTITYNNEFGIYLHEYSSNNIIFNNDVINHLYGIYLDDYSNNNHIYHNNFINNTWHAYDTWNNIYNNQYPSGGNYWSDYYGDDEYRGPSQDIPGSDGIGDTPYYISGGSNRDWYPLMYFWSGVIGDLDGDGDVDLSDLAQLLAHYGTIGDATYWMGDIDGDGDVDLSDLAALLANYGTGT